jgi:hypothetical protein
VRRAWRFGQAKPVTCHVIISDTETSIWNNVQRKAADHLRMKRAMAGSMVAMQQEATLRRAYGSAISIILPSFLK